MIGSLGPDGSGETPSRSAEQIYLDFIVALSDRADAMASGVTNVSDAIERLTSYGLRVIGSDRQGDELAYVAFSAAVLVGLKRIRSSSGHMLPYDLYARRESRLVREHPSYPVATLASACLEARFENSFGVNREVWRPTRHDSLLELAKHLDDRSRSLELLRIAGVPENLVRQRLH